ncbi:hypothetical protein M3626_21035 [Psychrobacillus sp. MER TA 17]|nr:hypothetical protein [Psychrobacillus sp. MER TA 17]
MEQRYFYCYSPRLATRLIEAGERYICVGLNEKTHKKFWLFPQSNGLDNVLDEWRASRPAH